MGAFEEQQQGEFHRRGEQYESDHGCRASPAEHNVEHTDRYAGYQSGLPERQELNLIAGDRKQRSYSGDKARDDAE
jgi:hypothetical protein